MRTPPSLRVRLLVPVIVALVAACDSAPGGVREWTPADHDQPPSAANTPAPGSSVAARPDNTGETNLVELAWQRNCALCHGPQGRGDGPQGPMLRAPDLTRDEWQSRVTDQEIVETIRKGRNKMPAFDLPPRILEGLAQRIRANRRR